MGYFFCNCTQSTSSGGSSGTVGKYVSVALAAGTTNNLDPTAGWPTGYGRVDFEPAGTATVTGLVAGTDGQIAILRNASATYTVTLDIANSGSLADAQFAGPSYGASPSVVLPPGTSVMGVYYAGTVNNWVLVA